MFLKKKLSGSIIDKIIRIFFNIFSKIYFKTTKKLKISDTKRFIYVCYGGLGDCVLSLPFLIQLSKTHDVSIFIEKKFKDLDILINENITVISYHKRDLLKELREFQLLKSNYILIQQSPIIEFMLFHYLLKRPPTIGFIYKQNQISFEGINKNDIEISNVNKISKYQKLLSAIISLENNNINNTNQNYLTKNIFKHRYQKIPKIKYFIFSTTKNQNWEMGFLSYEIYAKFLINLSKKSSILPVLVGTKEDKNIINNILNLLPKNINVLNLVGKTSIKDIVSLILESNFVIANDNGIHHLSNFLKKRTLTLYNFSSYQVYNWSNIESDYIFNPRFDCMPCVGLKNGPFDNYPFKCPWQVRCKNTISEQNILTKLEALNWIR